MKKLIIAGGTGFIGHSLVEFLKSDYDEIIVLTRGASKQKGKLRFVQWDAKTQGSWNKELEGAHTVINLTGKNINSRPTEKNRKEILESRVNATNAIGEGISLCENPPRIWINGSATNMYKDSETKAMTETDFEPGNDYWANVCIEWEKACTKWQLPNTRRLLPRVTPVFGKEDGVFPIYKKLVKFGLGGTMGPGSQMFTWIHINDLCRAFKWMIENENAKGPYNCCAPQAVTNKEQMKIMRDVLNAPFGLPAPSWAIKIGAFVIGTDSDLILKSRYVYPERLLKEGFKFQFPDFVSCIEDLTNSTKHN